MFSFEKTPWELYLDAVPKNGSVSAFQLLTLLEAESDEAVEDAFQALLEDAITLDISDLPRNEWSGEAALRLRREAELVTKGDLLHSLEEHDPLRLYLEELAGIPVCGDPAVLALELRENPCEKTREALVNLSLSRVVELAQEYTGYGVLLLDLIQEGSLGLWQGILSFRSGDFESHAKWWIRQYLHKAVMLQAREAGLGQKMKQAMEDYRAVDERLLADLGRNATVGEIAEQLHMTAEETQAVCDMLAAVRMLHAAKQDLEAPDQTPEDEQHVEDTAYFQSRQRVSELLEGLSEEEAKLISLRFGLEGGLPMSPEETGRKLGLTPEEVVAKEAIALSKMRK